MNKHSPIGVFDSGVGGLTVTHAIQNLLPSESIVYLGDTARVPYGVRDSETIKTFALDLVEFLLKQNVKALVVACNTISATCLIDVVRKASGIPVVDVIKPTVMSAIKSTKNNNIGIIGTRATIESHAYDKQILSINPDIKLTLSTAPLFVPLVEEGLSNHEATKMIAKDYLNKFKESEIDTLILGCTHYPILKKIISSILPGVAIIDSALPTAEALKDALQSKNLMNDSSLVNNKFYVTDSPQRSQEVADIFYEGKFPGILEKVSL